MTSKIFYKPVDGLRAFCFLLVFLFHCDIPGFELGWAGVSVFFVISGFLIGGILIDSKGSKGFFKVFYARRALRIFPVYYAVVLASACIMLVFNKLDGVGAIDDLWTSLTYTLNIQWIFTGYRSSMQPLLAHCWSLCVEEQFYLVFPLLVYLIPGRKIPRACVIMIMAGVVFRMLAIVFSGNIYLVSISPLSQVDLLALGVLLSCKQRGLVTSSMLTRLIKYSLPVGITGLLAVVVTVGAIHDDWPGGYHLMSLPDNYQCNVFTAQVFFFLGLVSTGIIDRCTRGTSAWTRVLSLPFSRHLGKISYGLYVYHWPVLLAARGISGDKVIITILTLTVTYVIAVISFYTVERFFTSWKRKFEYQ